MDFNEWRLLLILPKMSMQHVEEVWPEIKSTGFHLDAWDSPNQYVLASSSKPFQLFLDRFFDSLRFLDQSLREHV